MLKIYRQEFLVWQSLLEIYLLIDADIIIEYLLTVHPTIDFNSFCNNYVEHQTGVMQSA